MDELIPLSDATLGKLPNEVRGPAYDRATLTPGIVHIGLGNFHRAHQAWYLHRLMDLGIDHDWAIIGAGVRPADAVQRDRLKVQHCLTTLIELAPGARSAEVIGPMIDFLPVEDGNTALIAGLSDPSIRIVSLTVTEGGYYMTQGGDFDAHHPDIRHDAGHPEIPRTAFGAIVAALSQRRSSGSGPFTILSCDNLQNNGAIVRQAVLGLARLSRPDLADWIDTNCTFPNSMVDCIVPATGPKEIALARSFGIEDAAPVTHEPFRQWVIEDAFCAGRPALEKIGVTFTDRVHDYEKMKLSILNAGHQILANPGELLSIDTISACMEHPEIRAYFHKLQQDEIVPQVDPVPEMSPGDYLALIERRFSNPAIVDTTRRVAFDGSSRHTGFLHPIIRERLSNGKSIDGLALAEALWARMCEGTREDGSLIEANDPRWPELTAAAAAAKTSPRAWLDQRGIYGDWAREEPFASRFSAWLGMLYRDGVTPALSAYLTGAA